MESEVGLSQSGVKKIINSALSPNLRKTTGDLPSVVASLAELFINEIMEKSIEVCNTKGKKTINPSHVLEALTAMNMTYDAEETERILQEYEASKCTKPKYQLKLKREGSTLEELAAEQAQLMALANPQLPKAEPKQIDQDQDDYD